MLGNATRLLRSAASTSRTQVWLHAVQEQNYSAKDAQTLELPDDATKARLASDPFYRLEETGGRRLRVLDATDQVEQLMSLSKARGADGNDMKLNRQLKQGVRARRAADHACEARCGAPVATLYAASGLMHAVCGVCCVVGGLLPL